MRHRCLLTRAWVINGFVKKRVSKTQKQVPKDATERERISVYMWAMPPVNIYWKSNDGERSKLSERGWKRDLYYGPRGTGRRVSCLLTAPCHCYDAFNTIMHSDMRTGARRHTHTHARTRTHTHTPQRVGLFQCLAVPIESSWVSQ